MNANNSNAAFLYRLNRFCVMIIGHAVLFDVQ